MVERQWRSDNDLIQMKTQKKTENDRLKQNCNRGVEEI